MATTTPDRTPPATTAPMKPGDEVPAGTPGTGENVCPVCHGSVRIGQQRCASCAGTGTVTTGIGGA